MPYPSDFGDGRRHWSFSCLIVVAASLASLNCSGSSSTGSSYNYGLGGSSSPGGQGGATATSSGGATAAAGSAGTAETGASPPTFSAIYSSTIGVACLPCHSTGNGFLLGMLDMSTQQNAYNNLVGSSGTGIEAQGATAGTSGTTCSSIAGQLRVHPNDASTSLIWEKVNSKLQNTAAPCGSPMPAGAAAALTQAQVSAIAAWINAGALDD